MCVCTGVLTVLTIKKKKRRITPSTEKEKRPCVEFSTSPPCPASVCPSAYVKNARITLYFIVKHFIVRTLARHYEDTDS